VAYSNQIKQSVLKVSKSDIDNFGAVSRSVVEQMAIGARTLLQSDIAIATSGIAGPTGGTIEKPVGTVWVAVCSAEFIVSREYHFGAIREQNIQRAAQVAILLLKEVLTTN
jgi:nicotinamide-nucleotide amidase